ncbi:MAG: tetratricopeptide repeat protein [Methylococcales bacterium]|nr:tetratricopeptide repeat protein [Methylococcales bacterium]
MNNKPLLLCCVLCLLAGCAQSPVNRESTASAVSPQVQPQNSVADKKFTPQQEAILKDYADYLSAEYLFIQVGAAEKADKFVNSEIEKTKPYNLFKVLTLANLYIYKKDYAGAYRLTSSVLDSSLFTEYRDYLGKQFMPQVLLIHAVAASGIGKTDQALTFVKKANEFDDKGLNYGLITYYKAKVIALAGYVKEASNYLKQRIDGSQADGRIPIYWLRVMSYAGQVYYFQNNLEQAKDAYEKLIAYSAEANKQLAEDMKKGGTAAGAAKFSGYSEPEAHYNLGQIYAALGNKPKAIEHFSEVINIWPNSFDARLKRGSLYLEAKNYHEAVQDFSFVLKQEPQNTSVLYQRAYSYCMDWDTLLGREDLKALLQIEPKNEPAKKLLKHCAGLSRR